MVFMIPVFVTGSFIGAVEMKSTFMNIGGYVILNRWRPAPFFFCDVLEECLGRGSSSFALPAGELMG